METEINEKQTSVLSASINAGLITGLALIAFYIVLQLSGLIFNQALSYVNWVILIGGIVLAHNKFKQGNQDYMTYSQGLGIGTLTSLISGTLSAAFSVAYITFIDPTFITTMMDKIREQVTTQNQEMTSEQVEMAMSMSSFMFQPSILLVMGVIGSAFMGFIFALLVSAFTKNAPPVDFE
jgi:uncharacterized membrane protein